MAVGNMAGSNVEVFRNQFKVMDNAAVGVVFVRTREPHRVQDALVAYSKTRDHKPIKFWSLLTGLVNATEAKPAADTATKDIISAFQVMAADDSDAVFVMLWPHMWVDSKNPVVIAHLGEAALRFSESSKRLVMLVPLNFEVPKELEDMIPIMDFDPPSQSELGVLWNALKKDFGGNTFPEHFNEEEVSRILSAGAGMTAVEFSAAASRALIEGKVDLPNIPIDDVVMRVMKMKTDVIKRSEVLELMPSGTMDDIGGLVGLKEWVLKRADCFTPEAEAFGVDRPKGCALIGPPGTGKSAVGKAIASSLHVPLIRFDVSRVFNSLVGSSEARVREALKLLDVMAPCVVLVDELDKMFDSNSGGGDSGVGKRVLGAILTHLQEGTSPIFWVMTANRVNGLPPELLRKGRLDEIFSVTVPTETERLEVLKIHLRKRKQDPEEITGLALAAESSEGYVAAELEAAVKEALVEAFHEGTEVTGDLIVAQLANMQPLSVAFKDQFSAMQDWATNNARPASVEQPKARARKRGKANTGGRKVNLDSN